LSVLFLLALDKLGMPVNACLGWLRVCIAGRLRPAAETSTFRKRSRF
jgi:hypothetical protein